MRLIGILHHDKEVIRLSLFLKTKGIETQTDQSYDALKGEWTYQLWVLDEDLLDEAKREFDLFLSMPTSAAYDIADVIEQENIDTERVEILPPKQRKTPITWMMIVFCCLVYFINYVDTSTIKRSFPSMMIVTTIQEAFFYDDPPILGKIVDSFYQKEDSSSNEKQLEALRQDFRELDKTVWKGFFALGFDFLTKEKFVFPDEPLFSSIREKQVWRVFTPALLHTAFWHLFFNMLWLYFLGRLVEGKIGCFKTIIFSLLVAMASNTAQYLMSGLFFYGYSGVLVGLLSFVWTREIVAPWEGYSFSRLTAWYILAFVAGLFAFQLVLFCFSLFKDVLIYVPIANTAHIVGGLMGICLGRLSYFSQKR